ncbi:MAG: alpha/beta hydrolase [Burkholderiales bacterium]
MHFHLRIALTTLVVSAFLCATSHASAAQTLNVASTRQGVTVPLLVDAPPDPRAVVLLFAGGNGGVQFANDAPSTFVANFLVRSRGDFVANGIATAVVGASSDLGGPDWMSDYFRNSPEHAADIGAAVEALRARFKLPIWLVGTSRGTLSAASVALKLGRRIDGVVLTSGMTDVKSMDIDRFEVPVLIVHHERDTCRVTDYRDLRQVTSKLKAQRSDVLKFSGGDNEGKACEAMAYHGFNGIEAEVIKAIAQWIAPK